MKLSGSTIIGLISVGAAQTFSVNQKSHHPTNPQDAANVNTTQKENRVSGYPAARSIVSGEALNPSINSDTNS